MTEKLKVARVTPELFEVFMRDLAAPPMVKIGETWFVAAADLDTWRKCSPSAKESNHG